MITSKVAGLLLRFNNPEKEVAKSAKRALSIYQHVKKTSRWYSNISNRECSSQNDFRKQVPIIDKQIVFDNEYVLKNVLQKKESIGTIMLSSGASGNFSFGVLTRRELKKAAMETDIFLNVFFNAHKNKTILINASAMGVRAYTNHVCCDTGPRIDIVLRLLQEVSTVFEKVFVIADPVFIKLLVEESIDIGFNWESSSIYFISGGDWLPETLRTYVHQLTGKSPEKPEKGFWCCIYGLTELGYPLFFETADLVDIRSKISSKKMEWISPISMVGTTPFLFHYRPSAYYLEEVQGKSGRSNLVFTILKRNRLIPMVRYNTGDIGRIVESNLHLNHKFPLPVVEFWGRDQNWLELPNEIVHITDVKEILFSLADILPSITGFFTLGETNGNAKIEIQLKKEISANQISKYAINNAFISFFTNRVEVVFTEYEKMSAQMELDFERKFNHLKPKK